MKYEGYVALKKAADAGSSAANYSLGHFYYTLWAGIEAKPYLLKAYESGVKEAASELAAIDLYGLPPLLNLEEGFHYLMVGLLAEQSYAEVILSFLLHDGLIFKRNLAASSYVLEKAIAKGETRQKESYQNILESESFPTLSAFEVESRPYSIRFRPSPLSDEALNESFEDGGVKKSDEKSETVNERPASVLTPQTILSCHSEVGPLGQAGPLYGREKELQSLEEALKKKRMKPLILIAPSGAGKSALVSALAERVKERYLFWQLSLDKLVSTYCVRGQFERIGIALFDAISSYNRQASHPKKIALYIPEITALFPDEKETNDPLSHFGELIKPFITSGELFLIGAATPKEYALSRLKEPVFQRMIRPFYLPEMSEENVLALLKSFADGKANDALLHDVYAKAKSLPFAENPDTALEILDRAMARANVEKRSLDENLIEEIVATIEKEESK
jgi:ATP-dependent Clp protease ATP-binding subunit ClpA